MLLEIKFSQRSFDNLHYYTLLKFHFIQLEGPLVLYKLIHECGVPFVNNLAEICVSFLIYICSKSIPKQPKRTGWSHICLVVYLCYTFLYN